MIEDIFAELIENNEQKTYRYFTGQQWAVSISGKTIPVLSPHDQTIVGNVQAVTQEEADGVVTNARRVQFQWEQTPLNERIDIVKKLHS